MFPEVCTLLLVVCAPQIAMGYIRFPAPKTLIFNTVGSPCSSITLVNSTALDWPYPGTPPWKAETDTKVYNSTDVKLAVNSLKDQPVPGLPTTFGETFTIFQNAGCLLYIHGGAVRDFLLGLSPKDIDVEYSCDPSVLYEACIGAFGAQLCYLNGNYFNVGEIDPSSPYQELEGVNWNGTIFAPAYTKEYTTNALSYDLNGNDIIIDVVGSGVNDTCLTLIRIPVPRSSWWDWMTESAFFSYNGLSKLPRFWKLRSDPKSYLPADNDTLNFIISNIKQLWKNTTYNIEYTFRLFYCNNVRGEIASDNSGCFVNKAPDSSIISKLNAYDTSFAGDMGSQWYDTFMIAGNVNKVMVGWTSSFNLMLLDGSNGFTVKGLHFGDTLGVALSSAGDINGDGISDMIIEAYGNSQVYVVFGKNIFLNLLDLNLLNGTNGFIIPAINHGEEVSTSVSSAGDINGDGISDILIGAPWNGNNHAGQVYAIFGQRTPFSSPFSLSTLDGKNGFIINGLDHDHNLGVSVSTAGDVNGDGIDDIIVGAFYGSQNGVNHAGQASIVFGSRSPFPAVFDSTYLNGTNGFVVNGFELDHYLGWQVASAGDVNGDERDDILIGAPFESASLGMNGQVFVIFGATSFPQVFDPRKLNGQNGFIINGLTVGDGMGRSLSPAGDFNNDGFSDLLVGAYNVSAAYIIFGQKSFPNPFNLSTLNGSNGFSTKDTGVNGHFGYSLSSIGDINHDKIPDLLISSPNANEGMVYAIFGGQEISAPVVKVSQLNGVDFAGLNQGDQTGLAVSGLGDINNDGIVDFIIGAPSANNGTGESYVIFGANGSTCIFCPGNLTSNGFKCSPLPFFVALIHWFFLLLSYT